MKMGCIFFIIRYWECLLLQAFLSFFVQILPNDVYNGEKYRFPVLKSPVATKFRKNKQVKPLQLRLDAIIMLDDILFITSSS
jgi:hypothetical protein